MTRISSFAISLLAAILACPAPAAAAQRNDFKLLDRWLIWSDADAMVVRHLTNHGGRAP